MAANLINCSSFFTPISKYSFIKGTIKVASPISLTKGLSSVINVDICYFIDEKGNKVIDREKIINDLDTILQNIVEGEII